MMWWWGLPMHPRETDIVIDARIVDYDNSNHEDVADQACNGWDAFTIHCPVVTVAHKTVPMFCCFG
jgi:hypothetical protein